MDVVNIKVDMSIVLKECDKNVVSVMLTSAKLQNLGTIALCKEYVATNVTTTLDTDVLKVIPITNYHEEDIIQLENGAYVTTPERTICDLIVEDVYEGYIYDIVADYDRDKYMQLIDYSERFNISDTLIEIINVIKADEYF